MQMSMKFNPCQTCRGCPLPGRSELVVCLQGLLISLLLSSLLSAHCLLLGLWLVPNTPTSLRPCPLSFLFHSCLRKASHLTVGFAYSTSFLPRMTAIGFPVLFIIPRSRGSLGLCFDHCGVLRTQQDAQQVLSEKKDGVSAWKPGI